MFDQDGTEEPETKMFHFEVWMAANDKEEFARRVKAISEDFDILSFHTDREGVWIKAARRR